MAMLDAPEANYAAHARYSFTVQPVTVRADDAELRCIVRRIVAYRARCTCGWDSSSRPTYSTARAAGQTHRRAEHPS